LFNTYIAITQPKEVIEKEIKQDKMRFNADIAEVCLRLIALSLKDITPEKFVNLEDNISYEIPNKKIVSIFMYVDNSTLLMRTAILKTYQVIL
jgi:hypothetical protein